MRTEKKGEKTNKVKCETEGEMCKRKEKKVRDYHKGKNESKIVW